MFNSKPATKKKFYNIDARRNEMTVFVDKHVWMNNKIFNQPGFGDVLSHCHDFSGFVDNSVDVVNPGKKILYPPMIKV